MLVRGFRVRISSANQIREIKENQPRVAQALARVHAQDGRATNDQPEVSRRSVCLTFIARMISCDAEISDNDKKFLRSCSTESKIGASDGNLARSARFRFLTFVLSTSAKLSEPMSESQTSEDANDQARPGGLVAEYETRLTDAAALVARVRHEINNPLAALLGQAQLLLREELSPKARTRVEAIEASAKRIEKIVGELRDIQTPVAAVNRAEE